MGFLNDNEAEYDDGYALTPAPQPLSGLPDTLEYSRKRTQQLLRARQLGISEFMAPCVFHGAETIFDTATAACLLCLDQNAHLPIMARYRSALADHYVDTCPVHGEKPHHFNGARCAECYDARGRPRKHRSDRAAARRAGDPYYTAECLKHGMVDFYVGSGGCSLCTISSGVRRSSAAPGRPLTTGARAEARRAGRRTYAAPCPVHGEAPHYTTIGKCTLCFASGGAPRKHIISI